MLTYDAVVAAIVLIRDRGQRPSLNLILRETGGSKTDVSRLFKRWRDEQAAAAVAPQPPEIAALAALSPDLATRIRQAYENQSRDGLAKAQEDLALAQQHVEDLERALGDTEATQAQLRLELDDRAQMEQRLADAITQGVAAMTRQQSPVLDAIAELQRTVHDIAERQHGIQEAIETIHTGYTDLAGEIHHAQEAIAGVHAGAQQQAAALNRSVHVALDQQMTAIHDQIVADRTALLQHLHVRHLAAMRAVRAEMTRPVDRTRIVGQPRQHASKRRPLAYYQAQATARGLVGLAQAVEIPPGISHEMDGIRASIGRGIAKDLARQTPPATDP